MWSSTNAGGGMADRRDKFHIGQRVIWMDRGDELRCTVLSQREARRYHGTGRVWLVYRLEIDGLGRRHSSGCVYAAPEPELRPIYDGDAPSTWAECAWQPTLTAITQDGASQ